MFVCALLLQAALFRLRTSSVLVVGAKGLGAELCKNVVLAGVKSVTLLDHAHLSPSDLGNRFLVSTDGESVSEVASSPCFAKPLPLCREPSKQLVTCWHSIQTSQY